MGGWKDCRTNHCINKHKNEVSNPIKAWNILTHSGNIYFINLFFIFFFHFHRFNCLFQFHFFVYFFFFTFSSTSSSIPHAHSDSFWFVFPRRLSTITSQFIPFVCFLSLAFTHTLSSFHYPNEQSSNSPFLFTIFIYLSITFLRFHSVPTRYWHACLLIFMMASLLKSLRIRKNPTLQQREKKRNKRRHDNKYIII